MLYQQNREFLLSIFLQRGGIKLNIEELKAKQYTKVEIPGWGVDDTFAVKLKNFNLLDVVSKGKIPNPLVGTVIGLFKGKGIDIKEAEGIKNLNEVTEFFCEICLVEPTFKELKENEIELTDDQKGIIYEFATEGPRALIPFLTKHKNTGVSEHGADVPKDTQRNINLHLT